MNTFLNNKNKNTGEIMNLTGINRDIEINKPHSPEGIRVMDTLTSLSYYFFGSW